MPKIARIVNGKIIYGGESDISLPNEMLARGRRQADKTKHRKEMLQKNQVDFYRAYPEQAQNLNPELRRLLS